MDFDAENAGILICLHFHICSYSSPGLLLCGGGGADGNCGGRANPSRFEKENP